MFRGTAGHTVRTQNGVTASAGQRRGDVEIRSYLQVAAGRRSLVFDLSMCVCLLLQDTKLFAWGGGILEDMCYRLIALRWHSSGSEVRFGLPVGL